MFGLFRRPLDRRYVDAGRVCCPLRERDVEVDQCAACRWALEVNQESGIPFVRCRPERVPPGSARTWI